MPASTAGTMRTNATTLPVLAIFMRQTSGGLPSHATHEGVLGLIVNQPLR
jgi:hypothetical protein